MPLRRPRFLAVSALCGALGVPSTPTFYINGVHAADGNGNILPPAYFELALKLEIAKGTSK